MGIRHVGKSTVYLEALVPAIASATAVHGALAGDYGKAYLALGGGGLGCANLDTVVRAKLAGTAPITIQTVADDPTNVTIVETSTTVVIHYKAGTSKVSDVETAIAGATLIEVKTTGTAGNTLADPGDVKGPTALAGGASGLLFPGPLTQPDVPRQLLFTFGGGYDGGNIIVVGITSTGRMTTEVVTTNPGGTRTTVNAYQTIVSLSKAQAGLSTATVSAGTNTVLGLSRTPADAFGILTVNGVAEAGTWNKTGSLITPTSAPNGSKQFVLCYNAKTL